MVALIVILVIAAIVLSRSLVILKPMERGVVYRLGRVAKVTGPGIVVIAPFVDQLTRVSLEDQQIEIPNIELTTKDRSSTKVSARLRYRIMDPVRSLTSISDLSSGLRTLLEKTLQIVVSELEYEQLVSNLSEVTAQTTRRLDEHVQAWGVSVVSVDVERHRF